MPTNRTRRTRELRSKNISPAWRRFWETGAVGNETGEDGDIFLLQGRDEELKAAWLEVRDEIMADWQRAGKPGRPWIEECLFGGGE